MAKLKYRCINYGDCDKADDREAIELNVGEEPLCPDCKRSLQLDGPGSGGGGGGGQGLPKPVLLAVAALVVIGLGVGGFLMLHHKSQTPAASVDTALQEVWPWLK